MEQMDKRESIKSAAEFMHKSQGYVDLLLLKKSCPFPEFYLKEVLIQEGYTLSAVSPSQYIVKQKTFKDQTGPVKVDLFLECFGPKLSTDPSIGNPCVICDKPIKENDFTTLLALGPGGDKEMRVRAFEGKPFKPVVKEAHWACVMGQILEDPDV